MKFYYVYILQSESNQERFYTGFTEDLDSRLKSHNSGGCYHTSKYRPWHLKTAIAFDERQKALNFSEFWGRELILGLILGINSGDTIFNSRYLIPAIVLPTNQKGSGLGFRCF